jgi:hypothetical protein
VLLRAGACVLFVFAAVEAQAGRYTHPDRIYSVSYDDTVWERDKDEDELGVECTQASCNDAAAGCFITSEPDSAMTPRGMLTDFDGSGVAQAQLEAFAEQKKAAEEPLKDVLAENKSPDVAPEIVRPYVRREIAGHAYQVAEFRMSMLGDVARYASYLTGATGHSIAVVCYASEDAYDAWRPRFEAFVAGIRIAGAPKPRKRR